MAGCHFQTLRIALLAGPIGARPWPLAPISNSRGVGVDAGLARGLGHLAKPQVLSRGFPPEHFAPAGDHTHSGGAGCSRTYRQCAVVREGQTAPRNEDGPWVLRAGASFLFPITGCLTRWGKARCFPTCASSRRWVCALPCLVLNGHRLLSPMGRRGAQS